MPHIDQYPYQQQLMSEWCWCATAGSIGGLYRQSDALPQCGVADLVLGPSSCGVAGPKPERNVPRPLDAPLRRLRNLANVLNGRVPLARVVAEINQGRPVGVRIQWRSHAGAGHMVAITGFGPPQMIMVEDPKFGRRLWDYDVFSTNYLNDGFWSFTYLTRRQPDV